MESVHKYFNKIDFLYRNEMWNRIDHTYEARAERKWVEFIIHAVVTQVFINIYCVKNLFDSSRPFSNRWKVEKFLLVSVLLFPICCLFATCKPRLLLLPAETLRGWKFINTPLQAPNYLDEVDPQIQRAIQASLRDN